jgi:hypothetical protein
MRKRAVNVGIEYESERVMIFFRDCTEYVIREGRRFNNTV